MSPRLRRATVLGSTAALVAATFLPMPASFAAPDLPDVTGAGTVYNATIFTMTDPIYRAYDRTGNSFLTWNISEARLAVSNRGYVSWELAFYASAKEQEGSEPIYRLRNVNTDTYLFTASVDEVESAKEYGFINEGVAFYVPAWDMRGTQQVHRMHKVIDGKWRYKDILTSELERDEGRGWIYDATTYRVIGVANAATTPPKPTEPAEPEPTEPAEPEPTEPPAPVNPTPPAPEPPAPSDPAGGDGVFTFVQFPDTQEDVWPATRHRFESRVNWVLKNKDAQDIRFVGHSGDIVSYWETATNNRQYKIAAEVMAPLIASDVPFAATVGNHDTLAVGDGTGSANTDENGNVISFWGLRQTDLINQYFPKSSFKNMRGQMVTGKFDNSYHTFTAEGADFLVLSLEMYPRQSALDWAKNVIGKHPKHNVIILNHHYLNGDGNVSTSRSYGSSAPIEVQRQLVDAYPNVKMVICGHTGEALQRVYTTPDGDRVLYALTNMSKDEAAPIRTFEINVAEDRVRSEVLRTITGQKTNSMETTIDWIE